MPEKILKTYKAQVKSINTDDFTVDVVVSTASVDRDRDKIQPEAFRKRLKNYKDHPVLLSSHQYGDLRKQIGEASNIKITDQGLEAKFKYYVGEGNPEADWAWVLAQKGIAGFSIGFLPFAYDEKDFEKDGFSREFTDVELVEISQVLVPSNRDAVQSRRQFVTNLGDIEKEMLDFAIKQFDSGDLQAIDPELAAKAAKAAADQEDADIVAKFEASATKMIEAAIDKIAEKVIEKIIKGLQEDTRPELRDVLVAAANRPDAALDKDDIVAMVKDALTKENK
jgi:HK97 family phage prohead protease